MQKKKRKPLYDALATEVALRPAIEFYEKGLAGMEQEAAQYVEAKAFLDACGIPREQLAQEKAEAYAGVAEVNREIRKVRKEIGMCDAIAAAAPSIEKNISVVENGRNTKEKTNGKAAGKHTRSEI